jgi:hypothetical protein
MPSMMAVRCSWESALLYLMDGGGCGDDAGGLRGMQW